MTYLDIVRNLSNQPQSGGIPPPTEKTRLGYGTNGDNGENAEALEHPHPLLDRGGIVAWARPSLKYPGEGPPGDAELQEIDLLVWEHGYALLWSNLLQDRIAFYRDEEARQRIPPGFVPYSDEELRHLSWADPSDNGLRLIHAAKKLGGQITGTEHLEEAEWTL